MAESGKPFVKVYTRLVWIVMNDKPVPVGMEIHLDARRSRNICELRKIVNAMVNNKHWFSRATSLSLGACLKPLGAPIPVLTVAHVRPRFPAGPWAAQGLFKRALSATENLIVRQL